MAQTSSSDVGGFKARIVVSVSGWEGVPADKNALARILSKKSSSALPENLFLTSASAINLILWIRTAIESSVSSAVTAKNRVALLKMGRRTNQASGVTSRTLTRLDPGFP
ncbi:hypothetical protein TWF103_006814 [Orbilia oligospora]|nr:hypothetical protein TWF103_006814 [Orbilia oligospora]